MSPEQTVLLLGGTGRTGGRVMAQLLARGVRVRAVVRSADRLPAEAAGHANLTVTVADLPALSSADLAQQVQGCDAVISCLGHVISLRGVLGPPRDLVTRATQRVCGALETLQPARPVRFILMSSVSVNGPGGLDTRRGRLERFVVWLLRGLVPPARDNQRAADHLAGVVGTADPYVRWVAVRPDSLLEGDVTRYVLHDGLVSSVFHPDETNMANVARFMCDLVTDDRVWAAWVGKLPVIVNELPA